MTLLTNGKVLIAGGLATDGGPSQTTEVYDILTHTITPAPPMASPRVSATAVHLRNGRVLVAGGGAGSGNILSSAELYDPATNTWSNTGSMGNPRVLAPAVVLPDGRVLMAGGRSTGGTPTNTAALYNPATNTWTAAPSMTNPHSDYPMVLANGKALAIGGSDSPLSIEEYDPVTNQWTSRASPPYGVSNASSATVLLDGRVLVRDSTGAPLLFNPSSNTWASTNPASINQGKPYGYTAPRRSRGHPSGEQRRQRHRHRGNLRPRHQQLDRSNSAGERTI